LHKDVNVVKRIKRVDERNEVVVGYGGGYRMGLRYYLADALKYVIDAAIRTGINTKFKLFVSSDTYTYVILDVIKDLRKREKSAFFANKNVKLDVYSRIPQFLFYDDALSTWDVGMFLIDLEEQLSDYVNPVSSKSIISEDEPIQKFVEHAKTVFNGDYVKPFYVTPRFWEYVATWTFPFAWLVKHSEFNDYFKQYLSQSGLSRDFTRLVKLLSAEYTGETILAAFSDSSLRDYVYELFAEAMDGALDVGIQSISEAVNEILNAASLKLAVVADI